MAFSKFLFRLITSVQCRLCAHALSNHEDFDFIVPPQKATAPQTFQQNIQLQTVPERDLDSDHAQLNNPGPPDINSLEDESPRISRDVTVRALWKRVKETGVVHIRGTPASGKSNLARLLRRHVAKISEMPVISLSWPMDFPQNLPTNAMYYKLLNAITVRPLDLDDWLEKRVLLIIDEAQGSYPYTSFWNDFIKFISPGLGPCVAMFSSYGSPSGRPLDEQTPTPILLLPSQRISLLRTPINPDVGLYFSLEEYHNVVRAVCKYYGQDGQQFLLCENLKIFIWEITCGHPSAVRSLLDGLACADVCIPTPARVMYMSLINSIRLSANTANNPLRSLLKLPGNFSRMMRLFSTVLRTAKCTASVGDYQQNICSKQTHLFPNSFVKSLWI